MMSWPPKAPGTRKAWSPRTILAGRQTLVLRIGAGLAAVVSLVFAVIGDGVPDGTVPGFSGFVIDYFHLFDWICLTVGLFLVSLSGAGAKRAGKAALIAAAVLYVIFRIELHRHF